jgi:hypothetical protein
MSKFSDKSASKFSIALQIEALVPAIIHFSIQIAEPKCPHRSEIINPVHFPTTTTSSNVTASTIAITGQNSQIRHSMVRQELNLTRRPLNMASKRPTSSDAVGNACKLRQSTLFLASAP